MADAAEKGFDRREIDGDDVRVLRHPRHLQQDVVYGAGVGAVELRFDVINLFDENCWLRSSTSIGAFAPAYGPRRTFYAGISKEF